MDQKSGGYPVAAGLPVGRTSSGRVTCDGAGRGNAGHLLARVTQAIIAESPSPRLTHARIWNVVGRALSHSVSLEFHEERQFVINRHYTHRPQRLWADDRLFGTNCENGRALVELLNKAVLGTCTGSTII